MLKKSVIHTAVFIITVVTLWALLIISSCIPNKAIYSNMIDTAVSYSSKEPFPFGSNHKFNSITDNYADAILLNVMWNIRSSSPIASSIDTKYYNGEMYGENWGLYRAVTGAEPNTDYSRYWHGSVAFIRPLMVFTDADSVKITGFTAMMILVAVTFSILVYRKHYFAAGALVFSLIGIQFWNIRLSLEYIPAFIVCFILCPLYILLEKKGDIFLTALSVAGGTMIAFFDFLTVETISILLPLTLVFIARTNENRLGSLRYNIILMTECGIYWGLSYIMTFVLKWSIASIITGENKFYSAFSAASIRVYGDAGQVSMPIYKQIPAAVAANLSTLFNGTERIEPDNIIFGLLATALIFGGIYFLFRSKKKNRTLTLILLIIMIIPYARYMLLSNHSYLHEFFTYRAQITVILCLCSIVWYNIDFTISGKGRKKYEC